MVRPIARLAARVLAGTAVLVSPAAAQRPGYSLDQLLSAPFAEELVGSGGGTTVAWIHNTKGVRNVWVAAAPDYRGRQLTAFTKDDGQEITDLAVSPDGKVIFFVRGGGPNRRGDIPNPTSDPAGQEQALWRAVVATGTVTRVGPGTGPVISPRGDRVVFGRRGQPFVLPVEGPGEPTALGTIRSGAGSWTWSPDGSRIAFVSARGDHAFVGILDPAAKTLKWIDPSFDRDGAPTWSPDGTRIAFLRIPAGFDPPLFGPIRETRPFSIRIADVASGTAREIWRADPGKGSVPHGIVGPRLIWTADDRIVFNWEKDGWSHLYSIQPAGGAPALLTPGEGEVEYVGLTFDRKGILYNTNIGDIDRRHLRQVAAAGGAPVDLTSGSGIEWSPVALAGGAIAFLRSDARTPAHAAILAGGTARPLAPNTIPADFPSRALVEPEQVIFPASDGLMIHGQLFLPPDLRPGERRPAIAFYHGGSRRQMLLGFHYMYYYHGTYAMNQYLASQGYIVLSVNYRSGIGYGMEFREAENYGATGATEFNDVMGAGVYLAHRPDVDPTRIGLWGGSYGGYLTAMGLAKASSLYAAGADLHGVHDWNEGIRTFRPDYNPLEKPDFARLAWESSPLAWVSGWKSPVLLVHGDDDRNVDFTQSVRLVTALRAQGIEPEQLVLPDEVHDFLTYADWRRVFAAISDFFGRKLGPHGSGDR